MSNVRGEFHIYKSMYVVAHHFFIEVFGPKIAVLALLHIYRNYSVLEVSKWFLNCNQK